MSLTSPPGPLSGSPAPTNYAIDGPAHRLLLTDFPRRVRGELGGEVVIDTIGAHLLHETGSSRSSTCRWPTSAAR